MITFQHMSIRSQVALGFCLILVVFAAAIGTNLWKVRTVQRINELNVEVRTPTVIADGGLLAGLNQSLAELRGYMILASEASRKGRAEAWQQEIEPALSRLDSLSDVWTASENVRRFEEVRRLLRELKESQDEIEAVAHTLADSPGRERLATTIRPLSESMTEELRAVASQASGGATADALLARETSDVRASLALTLASLEAYASLGEAGQKEQYERRRTELSRQVSDLVAARQGLSGAQREALDRLTTMNTQLIDAANDVVRRREERGGWSRAESLLAKEAAPRAERVRGLVREMDSRHVELLIGDQERAKAEVAQLLVLQWMLLGFGVACAILTGAYIMRTVSRRLSTETTELKKSSSELKAASTQLLNGSTEQASSTSEFSTTIRELAGAASQIVERCGHVADQCEEAVRRCLDGGEAVTQAQEVTDSIKVQIEKVVQHMLDLGSKSQEINLAADVITELAEQTTILSYNAAIEAAAAGEAGQSFGVVAEQVGKLSDRAKEAVGEVRALIEEIQRSSNTTIMATEDGLKAADRGRMVQADASQKMELIIQDIQQTLESVKEIEMSATQQSNAADQVQEGIENVASAAKQFETSAKQCLEMANGLTRSAANLEAI